LRGHTLNERIVESLQDGQNLGEVGLAGRDNRDSGELAFADAYRKFD